MRNKVEGSELLRETGGSVPRHRIITGAGGSIYKCPAKQTREQKLFLRQS